MTSQIEAVRFIHESNKIEGIYRDPTEAELDEYYRFIDLRHISVEDMEKFVSVYQPNAVLRTESGQNVRVGNYYPPAGGMSIYFSLVTFLSTLTFMNKKQREESAHTIHQQYESLHPFTDCNGRSGRMLWMWQMQEAPLGFLHTWYYQSLSNR